MKFLDGKKSYAGAAIIIATAALMIAGVLNADAASPILAFGAGLLGVGLAHKLAKLLRTLATVADTLARAMEQDSENGSGA